MINAITNISPPSPNTNSNNNEDDNNSVFKPPSFSNEPITATTSPPNDFSSSHDEEESAASSSKTLNIKCVNTTSYILSTIIIIGFLFFSVHEEGIYSDDYSWMKYQTLVTPSNYVNLIWIPILLSQGFFVYASTFHKTYQHSPLVGYSNAISGGGNTKKSTVMYYPAICATTIMMVCFFDYGYTLFALLSCLMCGAALVHVMKLQSEVLAAGTNNDDGEDDAMTNASDLDKHSLLTNSMKSKAIEYIALILPFELYGGYIMSASIVYLNTFLVVVGSEHDVSPLVCLIIGNISLLSLLCVGFAVLWSKKLALERKFYGVGISLVWYLLGVAIELHEPSQPIYNEYSDMAILTTQIVAGVCSLVLMTMLGVRVMKTMIKHNLFNCVCALGGGQSMVSEDSDDHLEISTGYVHA